jgi:predicted dehydrogenase
MVRVGLIGSGGMASVYADRFESMEGAAVSAVASPNSAPQFVDEHAPAASAYDSVAALLADDDVDAVAVCSPTHRHREHAVAALQTGYDVIVEKPMARTLDGAAAMLEAERAADGCLAVAHVVRHMPQYATAKTQLEEGAVGTPGVARASRIVAHGGDDSWMTDHDKSGGVLLDVGVHDFDALRWLVGDIDRVFSRLVEWDDGESRVALTTLRFTSGAVGQVTSAYAHLENVPFTTALEISGDAGHLEYDQDDERPLQVAGPDGRYSPRDPIGDDPLLHRDGYARELSAFLDCVRDGATPAVDGVAGRAALRVSLAAIESVDRGAPVSVDAVGGAT